MYERILVVTDGSTAGERAVDHGIDLAETFDADLHALFVVDARPVGTDSPVGESMMEIEERAGEILDAVTDETDQRVVTAFRHGRPHAAVREYANACDADLVVYGDRGVADPLGVEHQTVAERVVRYAGRPVLTA